MTPDKRIVSLSLRVLLAAAATFATHLLRLDYIESMLFDYREVFHSPPKLSQHIAIVNVKLSTKEKLGSFPSFKEHASVLKQIADSHPRAVVFVADPGEITGEFDQQQEFANNAATIPNFYISAEHGVFNGGLELLPLAKPLDKIKMIPGSKTSDTDKFAKDGVSRRIVVSFQGQEYLHTKLAQLYNPEIKDISKIKGQFDVFESKQVYIDYRKPGVFPTFAFEDVLEGKVDKKEFEDKVIFIGNDTEFDNKDYAATPFSREKATLPLSELHANMLETLIDNSAPVKFPDWLNFFITFCISLLALDVVLRLRPLPGIALLTGTVVIFLGLGFVIMWPLGRIMDMAHPLVSIFICYYFFIPYRLIVENRRSWEYYQKHKLLSEVEQLKTNFIGMMSHDLKTPLARIQGMTDIVARGAKLEASQSEAVEVIRQSAEDLTRFITTILNYAQIESRGIELHKQSKDINQLVAEVIKKNEFLAKLKHIELVQELEPLFSISVDPELIKQVISNLIENAIKYSAENSRILVLSEEKDQKVVIQVADQGSGIPSEELPHIFMKFFRSSQAKSSPVKGSGLGLYLAKYFVELHKGHIFVESTPGQGSTFTVELPINS